MASDKELKDRIKSIQDTRKITNAMYMISSSKLQQAKKKLKETEPYFFRFQENLGMILNYAPDCTHRYFRTDENAPDDGQYCRAYVAITADKGLAGAYNMNVLKMLQQKLDECDGPSKVFVVGELGRQYCMKQNIQVSNHFQYTAQNPTMSRARGMAEELLHLYDDSVIDEIHIIYTKMTSGITSEAESVCLLPLNKENYSYTPDESRKNIQEFTMHPSPEALVESMIPAYITAFIYGALVEAFASEQNARMMAMQTATDSSDKMLADLSIEYNRVRQAAITQEITEIIAGAKALKNKKKSEWEEGKV